MFINLHSMRRDVASMKNRAPIVDEYKLLYSYSFVHFAIPDPGSIFSTIIVFCFNQVRSTISCGHG